MALKVSSNDCGSSAPPYYDVWGVTAVMPWPQTGPRGFQAPSCAIWPEPAEPPTGCNEPLLVVVRLLVYGSQLHQHLHHSWHWLWVQHSPAYEVKLGTSIAPSCHQVPAHSRAQFVVQLVSLFIYSAPSLQCRSGHSRSSLLYTQILVPAHYWF